MIKLSIAIAMYNAESTIKRCLDSILNYRENDLEIVIVNDGSTDKSLSICEVYAAKNKNINIYTQENGGVAKTRNHALRVAKGEYIWFIDSDDWVQRDSVSVIIEMLYRHSPDFYQIGLNSVSKFEDADSMDCGYTVSQIPDKDKWKKFFFQELDSYACSHIIKKSIYVENSIFFPEGMVFEDTAIIHKLLDFSSNIWIDSRKFYYYFNSPNSLSNSFSLKKLEDLLKISVQRKDELDEITRNADDENHRLNVEYHINVFIQILIFIIKYSLRHENIQNDNLYVRTVRILNELGSEVKIMEYCHYCSECKVSMKKYYFLYKLHLLRAVITVLTKIRG